MHIATLYKHRTTNTKKMDYTEHTIVNVIVNNNNKNVSYTHFIVPLLNTNLQKICIQFTVSSTIHRFWWWCKRRSNETSLTDVSAAILHFLKARWVSKIESEWYKLKQLDIDLPFFDLYDDTLAWEFARMSYVTVDVYFLYKLTEMTCACARLTKRLRRYKQSILCKRRSWLPNIHTHVRTRNLFQIFLEFYNLPVINSFSLLCKKKKINVIMHHVLTTWEYFIFWQWTRPVVASSKYW